MAGVRMSYGGAIKPELHELYRYLIRLYIFPIMNYYDTFLNVLLNRHTNNDNRNLSH